MNVITSSKLKIRLTRADFSSPLLGGPAWIGRELTLNAATAKRFVSMGYAEFVDAEAATATDKRENMDAGANTAAEAAGHDNGAQGGDAGDLSGQREDAGEGQESDADDESEDESEDEDDTTGENSDGEESNEDGLWNLTIKKLQKLAKKEKVDLHGITHKGDMISAIREARTKAE